MSETPIYWVVNTDLDATLLDHDTYSWEPASKAIALLKSQNIPLVLNSSKTLAEMIEIAEEIGLEDPLVCENGSFIAFPKAGKLPEEVIRKNFPEVEKVDGFWLCHLGVSRHGFLETLKSLRAENADFQFKGYQDWSVEEVAEHTGLPIEKAELSKQRNGTEPIHWHGTEEALARFEEQLKKHQLKAVVGGRFIHISGLSDKANGLLELNRIYRSLNANVQTIALGDSPNDLGMLNAADVAVVIPNHTKLEPVAAKVIHAEAHGPTGWNTSILDILRAEV